jgi:drug/metabolite transporter, DME family
LPSSPHLLALASAFSSAVASLLIQQGLRHSNFYAAFWINVAVGVVGLWTAVLLLVRPAAYDWSSVPYFVVSGLLGTAAGRLFRVVAIDKVGAPVAASILNMTPLVATAVAIVILGERVTGPILGGTLVIVAGTVLLSLSGRYVGFPPRHLIYPFLAATCFGVVQVVRKLGLSQTGPVFDAAINTTAALVAATAFVVATGNWHALRCERASLLYLIGGGIAENTGVLLLIVALGFGDVSVVTPLIGTAPLFVLLLAFFFPSGRRPLGWRVVAGAVLVVLGVFLLTGATRL